MSAMRLGDGWRASVSSRRWSWWSPLGASQARRRCPRRGELNWHYHEEGRGLRPRSRWPFARPRPGDRGRGGILLDDRVGLALGVPPTRCSGGPATSTRDGDCNGVVGYSCGGLWPPDQRPAIVAVRLRHHQDWPEGQWDFTEPTECPPVPDEDWVSIDEIVAPLDLQIFQGLGAPKVDISPQPNGLVTLPVILSTNYPLPLPPGPGVSDPNDPTRVIATVTVDGVTATVTAQATYTWTVRGNPGENAS